MKQYRFLSTRWWAISISVVLLIAGIVGFVLFNGFNQGIDFTGGITEQVEFDGTVSIDAIRESLGDLSSSQVQKLGTSSSNTYQIRVGLKGDQTAEAISAMVEKSLSKVSVGHTVVSSEFVGPKFSSTLVKASILVVVLALILILAYIWIRFRFAYAISSIVALLHDVLLLLTFIALFRFEFSSTTVAAILTIIGYSLNATIVIFDRIRENFKINSDATLKEVINLSTSQSLTRTIITSLTTLLAIVPLAVFARGTVQLFAVNLIIGIIIGTYSSNLIAPAVLYWILKKQESNKAKKLHTETRLETKVKQDTSNLVQDVEIPRLERKLKGKRRNRK